MAIREYENEIVGVSMGETAEAAAVMPFLPVVATGFLGGMAVFGSKLVIDKVREKVAKKEPGYTDINGMKVKNTDVKEAAKKVEAEEKKAASPEEKEAAKEAKAKEKAEAKEAKDKEKADEKAAKEKKKADDKAAKEAAKAAENK